MNNKEAAKKIVESLIDGSYLTTCWEVMTDTEREAGLVELKRLTNENE